MPALPADATLEFVMSRNVIKPRLNIGVIGAGRIGRVHAATLAFRMPEATVAAIADLNYGAAEQAAAEFGIARVSANADEILNDDSIDAVLICSSTNTHADLVIAAARSGKHIFCEKPLDHSLPKIDR